MIYKANATPDAVPLLFGAAGVSFDWVGGVTGMSRQHERQSMSDKTHLTLECLYSGEPRSGFAGRLEYWVSVNYSQRRKDTHTARERRYSGEPVNRSEGPLELRRY